MPIGDLLLFKDYKYCLNLGGFANISKKLTNKKIIAFDICAVNFVLNYLCNIIDKDYDYNGNLSKQGNINTSLLKELNSLKFFKKKSPKSLGREWVEEKINPIIEKYNISIVNKLRTFIEHIAIQISIFLIDGDVLITGGGVYNKTLIERIKFYSSSKIILPKKELIDYKEALIFSFLGVLKIRNENNCLHSVTGAKRDNSGGDIYPK